jgi:hypothetical protein
VAAILRCVIFKRDASLAVFAISKDQLKALFLGAVLRDGRVKGHGRHVTKSSLGVHPIHLALLSPSHTNGCLSLFVFKTKERTRRANAAATSSPLNRPISQ